MNQFITYKLIFVKKSIQNILEVIRQINKSTDLNLLENISGLCL